jgi:hypothetical protein
MKNKEQMLYILKLRKLILFLSFWVHMGDVHFMNQIYDFVMYVIIWDLSGIRDGRDSVQVFYKRVM